MTSESRAARGLFEAHGAAVYRFAMVLLKQHQDAEDCVQETFLKLLRHLDAGGDTSNVRGWLFTVAAHAARDRQRRRRRWVAWLPAHDAQVPPSSLPDEDGRLKRAREALEQSRIEDGAFVYSGSNQRVGAADKPAGSAARSAVSETTIYLLGGGSVERIRSAVEAFQTHWDELEKRRKKTGTHEGPYRIAPYYFYYGHRYAAQAIELFPEAERAKARERLRATLLKTRDDDGTWNDRIFPRSRAYGTATALMVLLEDKAPAVPKLK